MLSLYDSAGFRRFLDARAAAAAFLAALELKNVVVGSMFQIENPGPIYFIYFALIIANFLMYGMASVLVKPCIKLFSLPQALLMPSAGRVRREPQLFRCLRAARRYASALLNRAMGRVFIR